MAGRRPVWRARRPLFDRLDPEGEGTITQPELLDQLLASGEEPDTVSELFAELPGGVPVDRGRFEAAHERCRAVQLESAQRGARADVYLLADSLWRAVADGCVILLRASWLLSWAGYDVRRHRRARGAIRRSIGTWSGRGSGPSAAAARPRGARPACR